VARLYPERIAIEDPASVIAYRDLNRLANRIARAVLAALGEGSEPVALLVGNGVPVVAAMLGVLKAGKFYVTLDASLPVARLTQTVAEIPLGLLIADSGRMEQAEELRQTLDLPGLPLLNLDGLAPVLSEENPGSDENPGLAIAPSDLAYVLYTSGSTGKPKGVMQDHRYVLHLAMVYTNSGRIVAGDRLALLYSPSFAGAVRDIYCALLNGATLLTFDVKREGLACLADWLRQKQITVFFAVATMFRHFCRLLTPEDRFPSVRLIELGSETVQAGEVRLYQRHFSRDCRMIVNLGGSEISPICQFPVDATTRVEGSTVPAGYAAEGVELLLLDSGGRPVAAGATGEIVVRSRYLCRGYWGRPELTEAAFLPDPEGGDRRLYRTGDMGRLLPDGCLLHLGRCDFQVKIRGYRVETAEVEAFFTGTGLIRDAAVTAWRDAAGEQNLAAWLVPIEPEAPPSVGELRTLASAALPDYMVPATFAFMSALPTTENGKLDRRALPDPQMAGQLPDAAYVKPRTAVELRLQAIWSEILGREPIGIDENFFDLGGHSLRAMQVVARIAAGFRVSVHLNCLFEAPTIAQLAEVVERARLLDADEAIVPAPGGPETPLSLAQQRLWFLAQMDAQSEIFNMVRAYRLEGPLDLGALDRALAQIGRRHDNLRASYRISGGTPVQRIAPACRSVLTFVDLQDVPEERRDAALEAGLSEANSERFDLSTGPLWRVRVFRLGGNRHVLHLAMHHIVSDDWSVQVLLRELSAHYSEVPVPPLAVQYADYAHWQRRWLAGDRLAQQLNYWKEHLRGAPPLLELPLDRPRKAGGKFQGGVIPLHLASELVGRLRSLSRESETTLFVTLLAAYGLLLSRYGNPEDMVIGTGVGNRYPVETEALIGFFVNTLALRLQWHEGATFREVQACAHRSALGGYAHPDVPFDRIVEALRPDRSALHTPVFQTLFVLQNVTRQELSLPGLAATDVELERHSAGDNFDLTLTLKEVGSELYGALEFNAALFDSATIARMAANFETLLAGIVENPDSPAAQLPLVAAEERRRLLEMSTAANVETPPAGIVEHPDSPAAQLSLVAAEGLEKTLAAPVEGSVEHPDRPELPLIAEEGRQLLLGRVPAVPQPARCLHEWFDEQAARRPGAVAVTCGGVTWSYEELQRKSNRLAHRLQALGVGPDTMVGLCVERSLEMVAGILGILKAGGAYLPLDPAQPRERLAAMARDAGLRILVTGNAVAPEASACEHMVRLDLDDAAWNQWPDGNPQSAVTPDNLSHVIYTSGSTGLPKGTLNTHRNVSRLFTSIRALFDFDERDVWTVFHSCAFDFSVWELWGALLHGGRAVVVPAAVSRDTEAFCRLVAEERVTVLSQTPVAFSQLISVERRSHRKLSLRLLFVGGESWEPGMLRPWFERHSDREPRIVNAYGPTETTCMATFRDMTLADIYTSGNRIGAAVPDLDVHILDRHRQLVPIGVIGEMYIGGAGLARGYLNRPELTAACFIANPFSTDRAARLYKTGDLARRLPDGDLEYTGRADDQVKIRGYRIELGEIEAVLAVHPAVHKAAVVLRRETNGEARLVAYLTHRLEDCGSQQDLLANVRHQARQKLPDYMMPSAFVLLETMPLNTSGKLDRRALPAPSGAAGREHTAPPANPTEEVVATTLARVLGVDRLGRDDNFFEWGGHSLLAVQAMWSLCEAFSVELPVRCLFETPTAAGLARTIGARVENGAAVNPSLERLPAGTTNAPLSFAQQQMWILDQIEGPSATYNVSRAFRMEGTLDVPALRRALAEIVKRHAVLRTAFDVSGDAPVQTVDETATAPLVVLDAPGERYVQRFVTEESQRPFDLASAPLLRAVLLVRAPREHVLVLTLHHILADGFSLGILFHEWSDLCRAFGAGESSPLAPLPVQYADYAAWQRRTLQGEVLSGLIAYWKQQLAGAPSQLTLPTDRPRPAVQTFRGGLVTLSIGTDLVRGLESLSRQSGATMFMTLLAAYATLLSRLSGQDDVTIGSPISDRPLRECAPLIGFFVNTLALRVRMDGHPSFRELLARVRQTALGAYAHSALPFEQVVEAVRPERSLGHTPLFQAMFDWEPPVAPWSLPGVTVTPIEKNHLVAKCDLTLSIKERADGLRAEFEYRDDLFDRATIASWASQFDTLLSRASSAAEGGS